MKVFMSWSGTRSHEVAKLLGDWLQDVIQAVKPWISSAGIDRGELWFRKISDNLGEVNQGIVCLTPENKENPWIMFEAGALLKGLPESRVMTFLIDLKHQDVREPLSQFNHTTASKSDMFALVKTLNSRLGEAALVEARLTSVFNTFWPQFEERYAAVMTAHTPETQVVERSQAEILSEVLETVRGLKQQLRVLPSSSLPVLSDRRGLGTDAFAAGAVKDVLEDIVIRGLREGKSTPEILFQADGGGFPLSIGMRDHMIQFYRTIADDPRYAPVAKSAAEVFGGGAPELPPGARKSA
jgi:hypothetical protein